MERVIREAGRVPFPAVHVKDPEPPRGWFARALEAVMGPWYYTDIPVAAIAPSQSPQQFRSRYAWAPNKPGRLCIAMAQCFPQELIASGAGPRFQNWRQVGGLYVPTTSRVSQQRDASTEDFEWLATCRPKKLLVKGIMTVEDGGAIEHGADASSSPNPGAPARRRAVPIESCRTLPRGGGASMTSWWTAVSGAGPNRKALALGRHMWSSGGRRCLAPLPRGGRRAARDQIQSRGGHDHGAHRGYAGRCTLRRICVQR